MKRALLSIAAAAVVGSSAAGDTVTVVASKDNMLIPVEDGRLSNGSGEYFHVGRTGQGEGEDVRRALIAFDLSVIPAGSTINSATLTLYMSRTRTGAYEVSLRRVLADWGEGASDADQGEGSGTLAEPGDATWRHRFWNSVFWTNWGGDFSPTVSAMKMVNTVGSYTWGNAQMASEVQQWVDYPATNFGWGIFGDESVEDSSKRFDSRQNSLTTTRPRLTVEYTPPTVSGACCLAGSVCAVLSPTDCATQGGTYQGNGASCAPDPCVSATGACCVPSMGCGVVTAADCAGMGGEYQGDGATCSPNPCGLALAPFVDALPVPAIAAPISGTPGGAAEYRIAMTEFNQQLHRDLPPTRVWGFAGSYPGPTIEATRGQPVTVTWVNDLRDEQGGLRTRHYLPVDLSLHGPDVNGETPMTVVHLHGGHVPEASDGHPDVAFPPGQQSPLYLYPNDQPAGTIWYHDHALGLTRLNVYMGLAGFYLIRDAAENALNLPRGSYEVPLVIQDRSFNADGTLKYKDPWSEHFFGDHILVNGKVWPYFEVKRCKYRFRLLNGSGSRTYTLALSNNAAFWQIGTDAGLLSAPVQLNRVTIGPGERADVVMDFEPYAAGTQIRLTNSAPAPFPVGDGMNDVPDVMQFRVKPESGDVDPLPAALVPVVALNENDAVTHRDFALRKMSTSGHDMWLINDLMWDDITEFPRMGTTEVWSWINRSGVMHPMHIHMVRFQILDRQPFEMQNGQVVATGPRVAPAANEAGWKDTVQAHPFEITRIIARFEGFMGRFPYHCHILEHEDHEMMRQFQVVRGCGTADYDGDGDSGTDADIEAFFSCLAGACCPACIDADFDGDGDVGTDLDIEAFFRVLGGGSC